VSDERFRRLEAIEGAAFVGGLFDRDKGAADESFQDDLLTERVEGRAVDEVGRHGVTGAADLGDAAGEVGHQLADTSCLFSPFHAECHNPIIPRKRTVLPLSGIMELMSSRNKGQRTIEAVLSELIPQPNGCLDWPGLRTPKGYGRIYFEGREWYVHRLAYRNAHGDLPPGKYVCHRCDRPCCANPDHLFLGNQKENIADSVAKGRHTPRRSSAPAGTGAERQRAYRERVAARRDWQEQILAGIETIVTGCADGRLLPTTGMEKIQFLVRQWRAYDP
jgi:HNH endonuclease